MFTLASRYFLWDFDFRVAVLGVKDALGLVLVDVLRIEHPQCNLISNIGFDEEATHTLNNHTNRGEKEVFPILPLVHPEKMEVDKKRDAYCWAKDKSQGWLKDTIHYLYDDLLWSDGLGHRILMLYKNSRGKGINSKKI